MEYTNYDNLENIVEQTSILMFVSIILIIFGILLLWNVICEWKIFKKAGREGWESIVPIYNLIVKCQFLGLPIWIVIFSFIPATSLIVSVIMNVYLSRKFGKDVPFALGLIFLPVIFKPIVAFGLEYSEYEEKYCVKCGSKVRGNYCQKCGEKII